MNRLCRLPERERHAAWRVFILEQKVKATLVASHTDSEAHARAPREETG
jgi:hypothetical protein